MSLARQLQHAKKQRAKAETRANELEQEVIALRAKLDETAKRAEAAEQKLDQARDEFNARYAELQEEKTFNENVKEGEVNNLRELVGVMEDRLAQIDLREKALNERQVQIDEDANIKKYRRRLQDRKAELHEEKQKNKILRVDNEELQRQLERTTRNLTRDVNRYKDAAQRNLERTGAEAAQACIMYQQIIAVQRDPELVRKEGQTDEQLADYIKGYVSTLEQEAATLLNRVFEVPAPTQEALPRLEMPVLSP